MPARMPAIWSILFAVSLLCMCAPGAAAKMQSATVVSEVDAGAVKSVRLRSLPKGAAIRAALETNGKVTVSFLNEDDFLNYPRAKHFLFRSTVEDKISFTVAIPESDSYYVVFDNSEGRRAVKVYSTIQGASGSDALLLQGGLSDAQLEAFENTLGKLRDELQKLFIFEPFPIKARVCGTQQAYSGPDGIILCLEYVQRVSTSLESREKARNVLLFTLFHETAHILLAQWQYPFADNEEVADDFATVLLLMLNQKERLGSMAEFFVSHPSEAELLAKAIQGDRHPLSIERARNILRWSEDPMRVLKWQTVFVPHMQTDILKRAQKARPAWANVPLIERELEIRRKIKGK